MKVLYLNCSRQQNVEESSWKNFKSIKNTLQNKSEKFEKAIIFITAGKLSN